MRRLSALVAAAPLLLTMLACTCSGGETRGVGPAAVGGPTTTRPADGVMPSAADVIATTTPVIYVAWRHPDLSAGETIDARLIAVDVGAAAAPGTEVTSASFPITAAGGAVGVFDFSRPTNGWPAGQYRVDVSRGIQGVFGSVPFGVQ